VRLFSCPHRAGYEHSEPRREKCVASSHIFLSHHVSPPPTLEPPRSERDGDWTGGTGGNDGAPGFGGPFSGGAGGALRALITAAAAAGAAAGFDVAPPPAETEAALRDAPWRGDERVRCFEFAEGAALDSSAPLAAALGEAADRSAGGSRDGLAPPLRGTHLAPVFLRLRGDALADAVADAATDAAARSPFANAPAAAQAAQTAREAAANREASFGDEARHSSGCRDCLRVPPSLERPV